MEESLDSETSSHFARGPILLQSTFLPVFKVWGRHKTWTPEIPNITIMDLLRSKCTKTKHFWASRKVQGVFKLTNSGVFGQAQNTICPRTQRQVQLEFSYFSHLCILIKLIFTPKFNEIGRAVWKRINFNLSKNDHFWLFLAFFQFLSPKNPWLSHESS